MKLSEIVLGETTIKSTATLAKNKDCYEHFGIHEKTANIYGNKPEDIVELEMVISKNQTRPVHKTGSFEEADYWAWLEEGKTDYYSIYPQYFLLNMCFPNGIKVCEDIGQGKAMRVEIKNIR